MYNLDDTAISQKIIYKDSTLELFNRDFNCSEDKPLGYTKELASFPEIDRQYQELILVSQKNKKYYNISWELFITIDKYNSLLDIYSKYSNDLKTELDSSLEIYTPSISLIGKLFLEDNRLKDCYTNDYETYQLNIKSINVVDYFFQLEMVKLTLEGETL